MQLEVTESTGTSRMHDSLGDTLVVEVRDLFTVMEVVQHGGSSFSRSQCSVGVLVISLVRRQIIMLTAILAPQ